jgi:hypothetical protein
MTTDKSAKKRPFSRHGQVAVEIGAATNLVNDGARAGAGGVAATPRRHEIDPRKLKFLKPMRTL